MREVTPATLAAMLADGEELALIDVREELVFSRRHLLYARCAPLSRLELGFARLVPRRGTRVVLCDDADGLAGRAAIVLARGGYGNLFVLTGGIEAWHDAEFETYSGVNVPSKAFGECVEHRNALRGIDALELDRMLRDGADVVVLDSRPFDEYARVSIPRAINVPGAELVLRVRDLVPSPDTTIVVNCAGRTRSIIGAQSLVDAGVPNNVMALRNGTMGWALAGLACEHGMDRRAPAVSAQSMAWARQASARVAERFGVEHIDLARLDALRAEAGERTLYLLDVRDPEEYRAGHMPGAISAPGGQLVQATDQYIGTLGARIVLIDDAEVRAVMTASWLRQMGWRDVFVLTATGKETGHPPALLLPGEDASGMGIDVAELRALLALEAASLVDFSISRDYDLGHIPGAWFAIRARLAIALKTIRARGMLVLTCEDGTLAALAAPQAAAISRLPTRFLLGGNKAWRSAGLPLSTAARMADEPVDVWLKPYERGGDRRAAANEYLSWEIDLLRKIERDPGARFATS
ncbi:MAG: thiosulfate sulfurtransferase [Proteobacteria bacterium]|nr:thiosulfate sulfurtransferase [Pseudomonadota bacterium]